LCTYDADIDSLLIFSQYLTWLVTKNHASQKKAKAYQVVVNEGEVRAGDNQGLQLQSWDWECRSGSGASGDASVRRPPSRRRRRAGRVRGDAMRVRGSYQLWGNLEENPRMAEWGRLMR